MSLALIRGEPHSRCLVALHWGERVSSVAIEKSRLFVASVAVCGKDEVRRGRDTEREISCVRTC